MLDAKHQEMHKNPQHYKIHMLRFAPLRPMDAVTEPLRGIKRKRGPLVQAERAAWDAVSPGTDHLLLLIATRSYMAERSSISSADDDEFPHSTQATTPSSSLSSRSSSRYPSDINKTHSCTFAGCNKAFNRPAKLEQHLRSHTNTRPFVCPHAPCTKDFLRDSHLKHHITSAHTDVRNYSCTWDGCNKSFLTATRLRRHVAAHEGCEKFTCIVTGCGQTFRKHATLQAHVAKVHEGRKPFECAFLCDDGKRCNAGFDTAGKLKDHQGRMHEIKRYTCSLCQQNGQSTPEGAADEQPIVAFSTYTALQDHMTSEHPPTCTACGLNCASQATLKSHVEVVHGPLDVNDRRTHICPEQCCGAGFTKKGNLNVHIKTVHGEQRFVCTLATDTDLKGVEGWDGVDACGMPFTSKAHLINHIKTSHLGLDTRPTGKPRKGKRARKKETSALARLTGSGYADESGRSISCMIPGCQWRFHREYDHELHLQSHHGLANIEIQGLQTEAERFDDHVDPSLFPQTEAFNAHHGTLHHQGDGEEFWLGGGNEDAQATARSSNQWLQDEMEMHKLVRNDDELDDVEMFETQAWRTLDPKLLA